MCVSHPIRGDPLEVVLGVGALVGNCDSEVEVDDEPGKWLDSSQIAKQPAGEVAIERETVCVCWRVCLFRV